MARKWDSDAELRRNASAFFSTARQAVEVFPTNNSDAGIRFMKGIIFSITNEVQSAENQLISRCISLAGARVGNEKEIAELAWERVWQSLAGASRTENIDKIVKAFLQDLSGYSQREFTFVAPNHVMRFEDKVDELQIGPVKAKWAKDFFQPFYNKFKEPKWKFAIGSKFNFSYSDDRIATIEMPPICWSVTVTAAMGNVEEEAAWLINVALSLLRLSYPEEQYMLFPHWNDIEDKPLSETTGRTGGVIVTEQGMSGGGISAPKIYVVDVKVHNVTEGKRFRDQASAIFFGKEKGSLSVRFSQGLGWLTRGRQTADRAERFLFFFTAIEALLASDDQSAPVVQTITRYASVLLTEEPNGRSKVAKRIKKLYEKRSALVHTGQRNVSWTEAKEVQVLAEAIYSRVLDECDLTAKFQVFHESLAEASYGSRWPEAGTGED